MSNKPDWMNEEDQRSEKNLKAGKTENNQVKQLQYVHREPVRKPKAIYIQPSYAQAFDKLVFKQKQAKGKKGSQLAEEMILMLLEKYDESTENL
ncbi:hypothetical protein CI610_03049 [invertebrate metagenome]|uniref:Uncharacterized protein n=1 Tax=invertebrate metagenome TaxID=1711999 RepID=A0A2H9T472_9ZZZZ